jgi:hypothetical protein
MGKVPSKSKSGLLALMFLSGVVHCQNSCGCTIALGYSFPHKHSEVHARGKQMQTDSESCLMLSHNTPCCCISHHPFHQQPDQPDFVVPAQVSGIIVPLLRFYFHEEVRIGAAQMLSELLRSSQLAAEKGVQGASRANVKQLLDYIWPALIDALSKVCFACLTSPPPLCTGPQSSTTPWLVFAFSSISLVCRLAIAQWGHGQAVFMCPSAVRMQLQILRMTLRNEIISVVHAI